MLNRFCTYKLFKLEFTFEAYLYCVSNIKHRHSLSRFRCSDLDVLINRFDPFNSVLIMLELKQNMKNRHILTH